MKNEHDIRILRELAKRYAEIAAKDIQNERRRLWRRHNSLKRTRPMVLCLWWGGIRDILGPREQCEDPFFRDHELQLRQGIFQDFTEDDYVLEPWITQRARFVKPHDGNWGMTIRYEDSGVVGGANKALPPIKNLDDAKKMVAPLHRIDEEATARDAARLHDAIGDILPVNIDRSPAYRDIANRLAVFRGDEQLMMDMYDNPEWLENLLAFMRDGILRVQEEAEKAGDWRLCAHNSFSVPYEETLRAPVANGESVGRKALWMAFNAQEFTLVSPEQHERFMLRYQLPIMKAFGLTHYGCCEDLTRKIDMLRQVPNLRRIAVTPWADLAKCAEQIRGDYVLSWHPNPSDMGCCGFDETKIRRIIREGLETTRGCHVDIVFKDVQTVEGEPERLRKWSRMVRAIAEDFA